jgi:hypothetical protein
MEIHIQTSYANKLERDRISSAKYYQEHKAEILEKKTLSARHERTKKHMEYNVTLVDPCQPLVDPSYEKEGKTVILSVSCRPVDLVN